MWFPASLHSTCELSTIRCTEIIIPPHLGPKRSRGGYCGIRGANQENGVWLLDRGRSVAVDSQSGGVLYLTRWSTSLALVLVEIPTTVNPTVYVHIYIYSGLHHTPQGDGRELNPLVTHLFPELFDLGPKKTTQRTRRAPETNGLLGNDVTQTTQVIIFQLVFSVCRSRRWFIFKGTLWLGRAKIRCKRDNDMRYYISWRVTCLSVQLTRNLHL